MTRFYADRLPWTLEPHYSRHVEAMTTEGLHKKSAIAAELAFRDAKIAEVKSLLLDKIPDCEMVGCDSGQKVTQMIRYSDVLICDQCAKDWNSKDMFWAEFVRKNHNT